jgi:hypothetical protein
MVLFIYNSYSTGPYVPQTDIYVKSRRTRDDNLGDALHLTGMDDARAPRARITGKAWASWLVRHGLHSNAQFYPLNIFKVRFI